MLNITNLTAGYGGPDILSSIDVKIKEGETVAIIGPNGAGKSTILKSIFGLCKISSGKIEFFSENLVGTPTNQIIKRGICYVPQGRSVFPSLTVEENLEMGAFILNDKTALAKDFEYVYTKFPHLKKRKYQPAGTLSGGEQQMVAIGRALMLRPKLLLLDEPSIGLAPKIVMEVFEKCKEIAASGTAILMVEQNANLALEYADRGYVLELGKNILSDTGKNLLAHHEIGELYLGKTDHV